MYHPLYLQSRGWVGRTVLVHHRSGRTYQGTLLHVEPHGLYLMPNRVQPGLMSHSQAPRQVEDLDLNPAQLTGMDPELVYAGAGYFAFGALAGLTLGAMAGGMYW